MKTWSDPHTLPLVGTRWKDEDGRLRIGVPRLAMDSRPAKASWFDQDGRAHFAAVPITRAGVVSYRGGEIPNWRKLGLDSNRVYRILRHPDELARAAPTFSGIPVTTCHLPTAGCAMDAGIVIGTLGSRVKYHGNCLAADCVVWSGGAIADIESGYRRALSCGYSYDAVMAPGKWRNQEYDGYAENVVGHHIALVEKSRVDNTELSWAA